jgi:anti-anti-sigma regulatory factor
VPKSFLLPVELTIYSVGKLAPRLRAHLAERTVQGSPQCLRIDAADVEEIDAAGVQQLLALANTLTGEHCVLQLVSPSASLVRACAGLGASALLSEAAP